IVCPPLRERREDIKELALHFMRKAALAAGRDVKDITPDALEVLETYDWPGNVRQLEMAMERAVLLGEGAEVERLDLPEELIERPAEPVMASGDGGAPPGAPGGLDPIIPEGTWEEHEKAKILEALQRTNWNITRAAHLLGMTFRTLQYRLEKFGIKRP
ncbi:MAG TPA: helix-turn-helix domain-containing protein, partial [Terriglobia bacterium]|nr:helix-turn-helix domain-containing protein [Terriglobia bacterium]